MRDGMKTVEQLKKEVEQTTLPQGTKELFYKVLDTADVASLSEKDRMRYESDLKNYMDTMSCIEFATIKGREEGLAEGLCFSVGQKMIAASGADDDGFAGRHLQLRGIVGNVCSQGCTGILFGNVERFNQHIESTFLLLF